MNGGVVCARCQAEMCESAGCDRPAEYEGWCRVRDFCGPTGLRQRRRLCVTHAEMVAQLDGLTFEKPMSAARR